MFVIFDYLIMFLPLYGADVWLPDQFEMFEMERKNHYEKLRYILVCVMPRHETRRSKWGQHHRMKPFQEKRLEFRTALCLLWLGVLCAAAWQQLVAVVVLIGTASNSNELKSAVSRPWPTKLNGRSASIYLTRPTVPIVRG